MAWLQDKAGWVVAALLFLLVIFRDLAKRWITEAVEGVRKAAFRRMAGSRLLRSRALAHYRSGALARYEKAHVPFLDAALPMSDIYVPLTAVPPGNDRCEQDAASSIATARRAVATGAPGAGKSMLLRHMMLVWATSPSPGARTPARAGKSRLLRRMMLAWATRPSPDARTPALCELHRHNGNDLTIEAHLARQFHDNGFPKAERFIERSLQAGQMTVLLDGFDEVSTSDRPRVAEMIKDFGGRYPRASIVVTCRTAVYERQLWPEFTQRFAVSEFDERMIRRFLHHWPGMDAPGPVEQLMEALRDTPRVMQLARNPLLLTMIAYLYAEGDQHRQLPHSRAEFYQEATDYLLRKLKDSRNRFDARVKKAVLQRLALACMEAPPGAADRMTLPYRSVMDIVAQTLPELREAATDAKAILAEIVERSGLLLAVDGGERYQFAHLTLQEFLVACGLKGTPQALIDRYRSDPTRWRECAKLWCGVTEDDCTEIIKVVYGIEPALGLECLADARRLDDGLADQIVSETMSRLDSPEVVDAFGVVAADPRPRGSAVYAQLVTLARSGSTGAVEALAATNTVKACTVIAEMAADRSEARDALVRMGDLAVDALSAAARKGKAWAVDGLAKLATPAAMEGLIEMLGSPEAVRSAWHLASLMRDGDALDTMRSAPVPAGGGGRTWYWEPFRSPNDGGLAVIVSRIGGLLSQPKAEDHLPEGLGPLDPRIGIPLWIEVPDREPLDEIDASPEVNEALAALRAKEVEKLTYDTYLKLTARTAAGLEHLDVALGRRFLPDGRAARLLDQLDPAIALPLLRILSSSAVTKQRWLEARRQADDRYSFDGSWHHRLAFGGFVAVLLVAMAWSAGAVSGWFSSWGPAWLGWATLGITAIALFMLVRPLEAHDDSESLFFASIGLLVLAFEIRDDPLDSELWAVAAAGTALPLSVFVTLMNHQLHVGWWVAAASILVPAAIVGLIVALGLRKDRLSHNPLRDLVAQVAQGAGAQ